MHLLILAAPHSEGPGWDRGDKACVCADGQPGTCLQLPVQVYVLGLVGNFTAGLWGQCGWVIWVQCVMTSRLCVFLVGAHAS